MIPITATTGKTYFMNILANPMVRMMNRPRKLFLVLTAA